MSYFTPNAISLQYYERFIQKLFQTRRYQCLNQNNKNKLICFTWDKDVLELPQVTYKVKNI